MPRRRAPWRGRGINFLAVPESYADGWKLRLLGDFSMKRGGTELRRLRAQKYAYLLAYLALSPDRAHTRETLIDLFWPDEPLENGRTCLRTALSSLRRQLGDPDLFLDGPREVVKLRPGSVSCDVTDFEIAVCEGRPDAPQLYTGPLLPGCYYDWAFDERHRLEALYESLAPASTSPSQGVDRSPQPVESLLFRVPSPISAFHGREGEIQELRALLDSGRRLISLVGLGGIGKTRLAIELGRSLPCRVGFVELAELLSPEEIPVAVAEGIRMPLNADALVQPRLELELGTEPTVLILDNFEQLIGIGGSEWIARLLESTQDLSVVVTSRVAIGLAGELAYFVPPLSESASVKLFLDRARAALPDFSNSDHLSELCERLDRIPLAIELCASWASVLSSRRMVEALSSRFELMRARKRNVPERQRSLRAVLEWACPEEQQLRSSFAMLSVMRGNWSLEAAEAVIGDEASEMLDRLLERALITRHPDEEGPRFSMLEAVREFAFEHLVEADLESARSRHSRYYCRLAVALGNEHMRDSRVGFERLEREQANILAAFQFGVTGSPDVLEATISALEFIRWIWWVRGYELQLRQLVSQIAERDDALFVGALKALVLRCKARQAGYEDRFSDAVRFLDAARQIWADNRDEGRAAEALKASAIYKVALGRVQDAVTDLHEALDMLSEGSTGYYIMMAELAGILLRETNDLDEVERLYREMLAHWSSQPGETGHQAVISAALAECSMKRGDPGPAEDLLRTAIRSFDERGELVKAVEVCDRLADCLDSMGRHEEAADARRSADERRASLGARR